MPSATKSSIVRITHTCEIAASLHSTLRRKRGGERHRLRLALYNLGWKPKNTVYKHVGTSKCVGTLLEQAGLSAAQGKVLLQEVLLTLFPTVVWAIITEAEKAKANCWLATLWISTARGSQACDYIFMIYAILLSLKYAWGSKTSVNPQNQWSQRFSVSAVITDMLPRCAVLSLHIWGRGAENWRILL